MDGSIQTACFNPVTNRLFIGTTKDTGIYIPDATANALDRKGIKSKVTCGDWTSDGRLLAFGTSTGLMAVKDAQFEKKVNVQKLSGISCVKWSPTTAELPDLILVVACIDQSISIHREDGEIIGFEKRVKYEVHALDWYCTGEYFIAGGSSPIVTIFAREGTILQEIETGFDWIWSCKFQNTLNAFAIGGNKGQIKVMAFDKLMPIAVSEDKFSTRLGMTEIVIKDLNSDKKAKFRCKELVKNISINGKALAVHTLSRILFYEEYNLYGEGDQQMHVESFSYKPIGKLDKKLEGNFFTLLAENFILSKDNRISSYDMSKNLSREWVFDSNVCFLKRLGGPAKEECLLVGLKNGNAFKIFVSNPFPILIIEHGVEITSLDMNLSKKLMAVVDAKNNFYLYDVAKKESITSELKISQCMFSQDFENMYVVMGEGVVYVKSTEFEGVTAPASGNIISFKGNKVRVVNGETVTTIEVPFTPFLMHYMSKKDFKNGYKIACIGVSDNDMRYIGMEALKNKEFAIARKCFTRTRDLEYLDIINRCEAESKSGKFDELGLQVELLCYDKKIPKAIEVLKKDGNLEKAIELCITMRKWSDAMELIKSAQSSGKLKSDKFNLFKLLKMQADSEAMKGNWRAAVDLLISANQESRAVEILIKNDQEEQVIQLMRKLNKTAHGDTLRECVKYFVGKKNHNAGKEALLKLGDQEELMKFHIELEHWDEAQMLAASDDSLKQIMLIPYADWLSKKNRFDEASEYYKQAGRVDLAMQILQTLSELSVVQEKFREAGQFHWILAKEMLKGVNSFRNPSVDDKEKIAKFNSCLSKSFIYQAYHPVLAYTRSPIKEEDYPGQHKIIFNSSRFIMANMKSANNAKVGQKSI
jgi:intraflagellar transport protein 122